MTPTDSKNFFRLVSDALGYWKQDASEFTLQVWWQGCQPFSLEQVSKALTAHATDPDKGQFAPKVADMVRQLAGTKTDRSLMAWGRVHDAMGQVGAYQDVDFCDSAIHAAIMDLGGWVKLCRTDLKELGYAQHRFCESYRAYQTAGTTDIAALVGDCSTDTLYAKRGLPTPKPVQIGGGKRWSGSPERRSSSRTARRHSGSCRRRTPAQYPHRANIPKQTGRCSRHWASTSHRPDCRQPPVLLAG